MTNIIPINPFLEKKVEELEQKTISNDIPPKTDFPLVKMDRQLRTAREEKVEAECAARLAAAAALLNQKKNKTFLQRLWEIL